MGKIKVFNVSGSQGAFIKRVTPNAKVVTVTNTTVEMDEDDVKEITSLLSIFTQDDLIAAPKKELITATQIELALESVSHVAKPKYRRPTIDYFLTLQPAIADDILHLSKRYHEGEVCEPFGAEATRRLLEAGYEKPTMLINRVVMYKAWIPKRSDIENGIGGFTNGQITRMVAQMIACGFIEMDDDERLIGKHQPDKELALPPWNDRKNYYAPITKG